jgi:hypothetical protein
LFYYAALTLDGNDLLPQSNLEIAFAALIILLGFIVIGIIIGEFSHVMNELTQKARI